jgi:hypothetical protein
LAAEARRRGWIVEQLPGRHLHQLVDPDGVTRSLVAIAGRLGVDTPHSGLGDRRRRTDA